MRKSIYDHRPKAKEESLLLYFFRCCRDLRK